MPKAYNVHNFRYDVAHLETMIRDRLGNLVTLRYLNDPQVSNAPSWHFYIVINTDRGSWHDENFLLSSVLLDIEEGSFIMNNKEKINQFINEAQLAILKPVSA